jgi:hypothetical protein
MTRKDYVKIAEILRNEQADNNLIDSFCKMLKADNERFNTSRFINACITGVK